MPSIDTLVGVIQLRSVYYREKPAFLRPVAHFVACAVSEAPFIVVSALIFATITYFMAGLNLDTWYRFPNFVLVYVLLQLVSVSYAQLIGKMVITVHLIEDLGLYVHCWRRCLLVLTTIIFLT